MILLNWLVFVSIILSLWYQGIPISQQHLIWKSIDLQDDYCLHDYRYDVIALRTV